MSRVVPCLSLIVLSFPGLVGCEADGASAQSDQSAPRDLSTAAADLAVDLAIAADLAVAPDMALLPDMTASGDQATSGEVTVTVEDVMAWQDCMPIVAPDPLHFEVDVTWANPRMAASETVHVTGGAVLDANGKVIATFGLDPVKDFMIPAGSKTTVHVQKTANTLQPAKACDSVPCNATVTWAVYWTLGGGPQRTATSGSGPMTCVH